MTSPAAIAGPGKDGWIGSRDIGKLEGALKPAAYVARAYKYAREHWQPWIAVMTLIYMPDAQWGIGDEQTYWSVIYPGYPELRLRPAYQAIKAMPKE